MRARGVNWIERSARILACASLALAPTLSLAASEEDPWESINRPIFTFNDTLDTYALKPLAQGYQKVTPNFVQDGVHNFFNNLGDVKNLANNLLQAKFHNAGVDTSRLLFNSTFGLAGLIDVATPMGLQRNDEDFGQTLGYWGVGSGPYVMLPFLGPSTLRDAPAKIPDIYVSPYHYMDDVRAQRDVRHQYRRHPCQPAEVGKTDQRRQVHLHPQRLPAEPRVQGQGRRGGGRLLSRPASCDTWKGGP